MHKLQWNINQNSYIFSQKKASENVVWKMSVILPRLQCDRIARPWTTRHLACLQGTQNKSMWWRLELHIFILYLVVWWRFRVILHMGSTSERRRYTVMSSLIGKIIPTCVTTKSTIDHFSSYSHVLVWKGNLRSLVSSLGAFRIMQKHLFD